jgi:hypothetical protein
MWIVMTAGGSVFLVMSAAGLVARATSERRRRLAKASGASPWLLALVIAASGLLAVGGVLQSHALVYVAWAGFVGNALLMRARWRNMDDPPPMMKRLQEVPMNPLDQVLHPIRHTKQLVEILNYGRNKREQEEWARRRGLDR